jgi:putative ABC transport system permease protein
VRAPVWSWGVRSRPLTALVLAVLSTTAIATAVSGPLLLRAVEQSSLATELAAAAPATTALGVVADIDPGAPVEGLESAEQAALAAAPTRLFRPTVSVVESVAPAPWSPAGTAGRTPAATAAVTRHSKIAVQSNDCAGIHLTAGACPSAEADVAVSSVDAERFGLRLGAAVDVQVPFGPRLATVRLTLSGTYDAGSPGLAVTTPTSPGASPAGVTATDLLVSPRAVVWRYLPTIAISRRALDPHVGVGDLPAVRGAIAALQRDALVQTDTLVVDQLLAGLLDDVQRQTHDASIVLWVVEVQALALAFGGLAVVLQRFSRARAREWGVGRLRGVPPGTWLTTVLAEPLLPIVVGVPLGYLAGVAGARAAASAALRTGTPIEPWRAPVLLAATVALAGSLLVLVGASARSASVDLAQLLGEVTEDRRTSRVAAVGQTVAVLLAAVATYQLLAGNELTNTGGSLGLLAPALLAVAVVVVTVQLAGWRARRSATAPVRRLAGLVVVRPLGRTPSTLLRSAMVTVGAALVVFTTQLAWASSRNQDLLSDAQVGAAQVLTVQLPASADLRQVVDAADPSGRVAMAVQELPGDVNGGVSRIVAVDTSRLAAVSSWRPTWSGLDARRLAAALRPPTTAPVLLYGRRLVVTVTGASSVAGPLSQGVSELPVPTLAVVVQTPAGWSTVDLGVLLRPTESFSARLPCAKGCRLVSLVTTATQDSPYDATYTVASLSTDQRPSSVYDALLHQRGRWQPRVGPLIDPARPGYATATPTSAGLQVKAHDAIGDEAPAVEPADRPDPLPVVLGPATRTLPFAGVPGASRGTGLDGQAQLIRPVGHASVLPRALGDGALMDLVAASRLSDPAQDRAVDEVWLAPGRHPAVEAALAHHGVRVIGRSRRTDTAAVLRGQAPTRATTVALTVALLAALLVVVSLTAARRLDAPARRRDWRAMRVAGLAVSRIRRLAALEVAAPALTALVAGVAVGTASYLLSVRRMPIRLAPAGPPLDIGPSWPALVLVLVAGAVIVTALAGATAWLEVRDLDREGRTDD